MVNLVIVVRFAVLVDDAAGGSGKGTWVSHKRCIKTRGLNSTIPRLFGLPRSIVLDFLDRLFWTSSSLDSSVIGRFPAFSRRFADRFPDWDRVENPALDCRSGRVIFSFYKRHKLSASIGDHSRRRKTCRVHLDGVIRHDLGVVGIRMSRRTAAV
jgi:hypothetical protein